MSSTRVLALAVAVTCAVFVSATPVWAQPTKPDDKQAEKAKADSSKDAKDDKEEPKQKPFDKVAKDAKVIAGLFTLHRTDDKTYLELRPEQYDKLYMLSLTCESGLGERGFYAAQMCGETPIVFHREGKQVQLVARNPRFTAEAGSPISRTIARSFSDSIIGAAAIDSLPHPERKSELIDLGALLLTDLPALGYWLESTFRIPYKFDAKQSSFGVLKAFDRNVEIEARTHYTTERMPVPPLPGAGPPPPMPPPPPRNVPDPRSLLFTMRYSLSEMPAPGYRPRLADDRVGHFFNQADDFTTDLEHEPARRYINRWRLEKADPSAQLSKPKQPIVFWLENTIPLKYRDAVRDGALMYNKAFERIGFQDAIEVRQQPDDADWDPADVRYSTIRWFTATDAGFAIGPSRTNPFTGEIYDADISFSEGMTRFVRREIIEEIQPVKTSGPLPSSTTFQPPWSSSRLKMACDLPGGAVADAAFAFDLLLARGLDPGGQEADDFVRGFLKAVTAHEVGHTLGLRHNFHASTIHTFEQLQDVKRTSEMGLTNSVMEYIPTNISAKGAAQGELFQSTLGPYDYWAIEYAYKPIDATSPDGERAQLDAIAARGAEPMLAYATDEDAGFFDQPFEMDPLVNRFDLGSEPIKYYAHRVRLGHELWLNAEGKLLKQGDGYQILRRSFAQGFGSAGYALWMTSKYIGGIKYHRDHVGDPNGRVPFEPVPAADQRAALELLKTQLFAPEAFAFAPELLRKLSGSRYPDWVNFERMMRRADVPIHTMVLGLQTDILDRLLHPVVLSRLLDTQLLLDRGTEPFGLSALFKGLQDAIWQDAATPASARVAVNSYRRALQRAHLKKLAALAVKDGEAPEDARSLARESLASLRAKLRVLAVRPPAGVTAEVRAYVAESLARIDQVLNPVVSRSGF